MALIPHLISTIVIRPWSCGSPCYLHSVLGRSSTNHLQGCTIKPTTACLLSFYTLFTFSHWNTSSSTADSENKHSERWRSADLALYRAGLIAQFIPSLREETPERKIYTAFCACSSIQCHNSGTYSYTTMGPQTLLPHLNSTASSTPPSFFAARKVFLTGSQKVLLKSYIHSYATHCLH